MAGLFEKDIRLLLKRKQILFIYLVLALLLGYTQDSAFVLGYLPFLGGILSISTVSYDEMDNGYTFLMTLPIDAAAYVKEKFIFCMGGTTLSWLLAVVISVFFGYTREGSCQLPMNIPVIVSFLLVMLLLMSVMLPLQIKFGAEKSRIVVLGVIGGVAVLGFLLSKVFELKSMDETIKMLDAVPESIFVTEVVLFVVAVMVISYFSSLRIMKNKEL